MATGDISLPIANASGKWVATTQPAGELNLEDRFVQLFELAGDPAAPAANKARLFVKDNGAGKTQLCVRFPTGAVQVVATEP